MNFKLTKKFLALAIILSIVAPSFSLIKPELAHAQAIEPVSGLGGGGGAVGCATAGLGAGVGVAAAAAALSVPTFDFATFTVQAAETSKECIFDGLAVLLREVLISQVVRSIVNWINSGFDGNPSFVTDLEGFLVDVIDETIGTYINSTQLSFLCSPFQLDIRIALIVNLTLDREPACTLTDIVDNIDNFYKRGFAGGWVGFIQVNTTTGNNPFFAYLDADVKIRGRIDKNLKRELEELSWGGGFQGFKVCEDLDIPGEQSCQTVTPGTYINDSLNRAAGSSINRLELADEIDEIIGALAAQLSKQFLTSAGGLLGSSRSSGGRSSYLSRTVSDAERRALSGSQRASSLAASNGDSVEEVYLEKKRLSLSTLILAESRVEDVISCYEAKIIASDRLSPTGFENPFLKLTPTERAFAVERIEQASSTISINISPLKTQIERDTSNSETNIRILADIKTRVDAAESQKELEFINENELNPLAESGLLHTIGDINAATQQKFDVDTLTDDLNEQTVERLRVCNNFQRIANTGTLGDADGEAGNSGESSVGDADAAGSSGGGE